MIQLIYRSTQAYPVSLDDLRSILDKSREKNAQLGITGVLFFDGNDFIQVLEGGDREVQYLFEAIQGDSRHRDVTILSELVVEQREFGSWAMAFAHPDKLRDLDDLLDYDDDLIDFDMTASRARQFLFLFVEGMLKQAPHGERASSFSLQMGQGSDTGQMVSSASARTYLVELGRTLALAMPEVAVTVKTHESGEVHFNSQGELEKGTIELF